MMLGSQIEGRIRLSSMLLGTAKAEFVMKNAVRQTLYCAVALSHPLSGSLQ